MFDRILVPLDGSTAKLTRERTLPGAPASVGPIAWPRPGPPANRAYSHRSRQALLGQGRGWSLLRVSERTALGALICTRRKCSVFHAAPPHEFLVFQTDLTPDKLPMKADGTVDEEKLGETHELSQMDAGKGGDLTLKLAAGHYVLMCNLPGHFLAGMHTDFTVTP